MRCWSASVDSRADTFVLIRPSTTTLTVLVAGSTPVTDFVAADPVPEARLAVTAAASTNVTHTATARRPRSRCTMIPPGIVDRCRGSTTFRGEWGVE